MRDIAVVVIVFLGLTLLIPKLSEILEGFVSRLSGKFVTNPQNNGFWTGLITGLTLGVVWAPCAGPILATIATLAATQKVSFALVMVTISYTVGIGIPLFIFATLGRLIFTKTKLFSKYTGRVQQVFGVIMILTAIAIFTHYDVYLESQLLNAFPSFSSSLTKIETNSSVTNELNKLKKIQNQNTTPDTSGLFNENYPAPDFVGVSKWLNTQNPLSIKSLKGKVVLVDFWTYTCINCIRTLPFVTHWYDKYKDQGFVVVGVHTPEFQFEHDTNNVLSAINMYKIHYPVAQDNDYSVWNNYQNQYWPAEYLINANGTVRRTHFGEGEYDQMELAIQDLLKESGKKITNSLENMPDQTPANQISPETYMGSSRMQYYFPTGSMGNSTSTFTLSELLPENSFSLGGTWTIGNEDITAGNNAVLNYHFVASKVYIILRPGNTTGGKVKVLFDNKPIDASVAGTDIKNGEINVDTDRLYNIVDLKDKTESHILKLEFETPGLRAYTFTFG